MGASVIPGCGHLVLVVFGRTVFLQAICVLGNGPLRFGFPYGDTCQRIFCCTGSVFTSKYPGSGRPSRGAGTLFFLSA